MARVALGPYHMIWRGVKGTLLACARVPAFKPALENFDLTKTVSIYKSFHSPLSNFSYTLLLAANQSMLSVSGGTALVLLAGT
jgi:hypothetical protein